MDEEGKRIRRETNLRKYGGIEGYRAEMKRRAALSKRNTGKKGGFAAMRESDPERFKAVSSRGGKNKAK